MIRKNDTIIISGGGTGGHIYPGIAIARAILKLEPGATVHFVGARGGLEEKIIPKENFPLHLLNIGKLHSSVGRKQQLITLFKLPLAFIKCIKILRQLRPTAVLGVGGYASGPMLFVASLMGFKTFIWEPNAHPGLANRLLSRFVRASLVVFDHAKKQLKSAVIMKVGLPVRSEFESQSLPSVGEPSKDSKRLKILIFGGSQGARTINQTVIALLESRPLWRDQVEIIHQTGSQDFNSISERYDKLKSSTVASSNVSKTLHLTCLQYIHDMPERMKWADLVIARSGASTVAEVAASQRAALFIPLPTAADDHQRKNAEVLYQQGACDLILQKDLNIETLSERISLYLKNPERLKEFGIRVKDFHIPRADEQIANILLENHRG